jgi:hypothetical protein
MSAAEAEIARTDAGSSPLVPTPQGSPPPDPGGTELPGFRLSGPALARDVRLAAEGWRRRFVGGPPQLADQVALYRELGHAVRVEALMDEDLSETCAGCRVALALFRIVYTRMEP